MYHSVTFGNKNTWDDWHLIPASRPVIAPPKHNSNMVTIPGMNGAVNISEVLTGYPTFANRTGSLQFYVANDYWSRWDVAYSTIMSYLHGQSMRMVLEDDQSYYYEGRFTVNQWQSGQTNSMITIDYDVYPYKRDFSTTDSDWLWDPFSFIDGEIRDWRNITVNGDYSLIFEADPEPVVPKIIATIATGNTLTVEHRYNGVSTVYTLEEGENNIRGLVIRPGRNELIFSGRGTVTVGYRRGRF